MNSQTKKTLLLSSFLAITFSYSPKIQAQNPKEIRIPPSWRVEFYTPPKDPFKSKLSSPDTNQISESYFQKNLRDKYGITLDENRSMELMCLGNKYLFKKPGDEKSLKNLEEGLKDSNRNEQIIKEIYYQNLDILEAYPSLYLNFKAKSSLENFTNNFAKAESFYEKGDLEIATIYMERAERDCFEVGVSINKTYNHIPGGVLLKEEELAKKYEKTIKEIRETENYTRLKKELKQFREKNKKNELKQDRLNLSRSIEMPDEITFKLIKYQRYNY